MPSPGAARCAAPRVLVLLAVRNGGRHLAAQLVSLAAQRDVSWRLLASDDGSTDNSRALLTGFMQSHPQRVVVIDGPRQGSTANFCHLIAHIPEDSEYVAFCDQDDVWLPDKLARAVAMLAWQDAHTPALYGSRTVVVNEALDRIGESPRLRRLASFRNALVQNFASGNTMVLNHASAALARAAVREGCDAMVVHDWWLYQLVTGVGGRIVFDERPSLLYRQHADNTIGAGIGRGALRARARRLVSGVPRVWHIATCRALSASAHRFTDENQSVLAHYCAATEATLLRRLLALRRAGVYRQRRVGNFALWLGALFDRV